MIRVTSDCDDEYDGGGGDDDDDDIDDDNDDNSNKHNPTKTTCVIPQHAHVLRWHTLHVPHVYAAVVKVG